MTSPMQINGLDVLANFGFVLGSAPGWSDAPPRSVSTANIATRGVRASTSPVDNPRKITLSGMVRGTSAADARSKLDLLKLQLSANPAKLSFSDQPTRYINARLDSFSVPPDAMGSAITKNLAVQIALTAHDPFFYDATATSLPTAGAMPLGTGIVRPLITLTATPTSAPFFVDLKDYSGATVATMTINQTGAGVYVIDCDNQILTKDGTNILNKLTGDFFRIDPFVHAVFSTNSWPQITTRNITTGGTPAVSYRKSWR